MNYEICKVPNYGVTYSASQKCIQSIDTLSALLNTDNYLHERLGKNDMLKLAVDVDKLRYYKLDGTIEKVLNDVADYCKITIEDISYTYSNIEFNGIKDVGSYHIVIPKCCMKSSLQKKFWYQFRKRYGYGKEIDADIFDKDCWFRLPNQTTNDWINKRGPQKGKKNSHKIIKGELEDFVLKYVEKATEFIKQPAEDTTDEDTVSVVSELTVEPENQIVSKQDNPKWIDELTYYIIHNGFENVMQTGSHLKWIQFGGLLLSAFTNEIAFMLWEKANLQNGSVNKKNEYEEHFNFLKQLEKDPQKAFITLKSWIRKSNPDLIKEYKNSKNVELSNDFDEETEKKEFLLQNAILRRSEVAIARLFVEHFGHNYKFVSAERNLLYVFDENENIWKRKNALIYLRLAISKELYKIINDKKTKLNQELEELDETKKQNLQRLIDSVDEVLYKLEKTADKNNIAKEICDLVLDTEFEKTLDSKKHLFAFNNCVMDLKIMKTRPIVFDDYISITCGYDYNPNPSPESIKNLNSLLSTIFPNKDVLKLYLQIMSCGLTGECIEKFVVLNGCGGNGKGLLSEFIKILYGDYGYIYAPVCLLTENDKTGANPEKVKLHKKRIVIMKEPSSADIKLKQDRIRDITGGGNISGRDLYAGKDDCEIMLCLILLMECNKKPLFESDPEEADKRRLIDILFENKFTSNDDEVDNITVFKGDSKYKTDEWKLEHRDAFMKLLIEAYSQFKTNNYTFDVPECVKQRTEEYINKSFPILEMFKQRYEKTDNEEDFVKIKDITANIYFSHSYTNLSKKEKRKYNKEYITEFFATHKLFRGKYFERKRINGVDLRSVIIGYKLIENDEEEEIDC
jgi:phage/plasmid-associated DNA primase